MCRSCGQALADYSQRSGQIDAAQTGSNLFKYLGGSKTPSQAMGVGDPLALKGIRQGVDGLESAVHNMTPENRALFRQGAQAAVVKAVNKVPGTVEGSTIPVLRRIFSNTPESQRWQRLLFETPEEAKHIPGRTGPRMDNGGNESTDGRLRHGRELE